MAVNAKQYAWENIEISILGRPLVGFIGISYKTSRVHEPLYGRGSAPLAIQNGNKAYEGSITLLQSEVIALNKAAREVGAKDLTEITFNISVSYSGDVTNPKITRDNIENVQVTEFDTAMSQGDLNSQIELPFVALNIKYNV